MNYKRWLILIGIMALLFGIGSMSIYCFYILPKNAEIELKRIEIQKNKEIDVIREKAKIQEEADRRNQAETILKQQENLEQTRVKFLSECEKKYQVLEDEATTPIDDIPVKRDYYQKACEEGSGFDRMENYWYCEDKTSYVWTKDAFIEYCINYKMKFI